MKICPACRFDRCDDTADRCRQCGADLTVEEDEGNSALAAAWFHYLQLPQIGTVELVPGKVFIFGREQRSDLVLKKCPDPESARVFWTDDYDEAQLIPAKGAKWSSKVDNVRVSAPRTLKGGEEVEVGPIVFKYIKRATPIEGARRLNRRSKAPDPRRAVAPGGGARKVGDLAKASALEPNQRQLKRPAAAAASSAARGARPAPAGRPTARGKTRATVRPADVATAVEKTKAFGTMRISGQAGRGWITVRGGQPQHAAFGEREGRAALDAILRLGPCRCHLDPGLPKRARGPALNVSFSAAVAAIKKGPARSSGKRPLANRDLGKRRPPPTRRG